MRVEASCRQPVCKGKFGAIPCLLVSSSTLLNLASIYAQLACVPVLTHWCRLAGRTDAQCASIFSLTICMRRQLLDTSSTPLKAAKRSYRANNGQAPRWSQTWGRAMELVQSQ